MVTVIRWTGREVRVLRKVLRMSVREFANHTGLSASAIADMEGKGEQAQLRHATQQILDEVLAAAAEEARLRFCAILGPAVLTSTQTATVGGSRRGGLVPRPHDGPDAMRGRSRSPGEALGFATGPAPPVSYMAEGVEDTNRRQVLAWALGATAGASLPDVGDRLAAGARGVDRRFLGGLHDVADSLASMYRAVDPRAVLPMAATFADQLLDGYDEHAGGHGPELAAVVVAVHCQVGLWACHTHQPSRARRYLATACEVAAGADDPPLHARALGALSYLYSSAPRGGTGGNPQRALELLNRALALAPGSDAFTRGWLATWRTDQHATLGDLAAARADVDLADAALDADDDGPERGFFARRHYGYGMRGHLDSVRGLVHALADELHESEQVFNTVQEQAANNRRRIATLGHQALALTRAAQPEAACHTLRRTINLALAEPYPMGLNRAVGVRASFDRTWASLPCVRNLDQHLSLLAPAAV